MALIMPDNRIEIPSLLDEFVIPHRGELEINESDDITNKLIDVVVRGDDKTFREIRGKEISSSVNGTDTFSRVGGAKVSGIERGSETTAVYRLYGSNVTGKYELPSDEVTVLAVVMRTGSTASGTAPIFSNGSAAVSPFTCWGLFDNGGSGIPQFSVNINGTGHTITGGFTFITDVQQVIVGTLGDGASELFVDARSVATGSPATGTITYGTDSGRGTSVFNFYNFTNQTRCFGGIIYLTAVWWRRLATAEVKRVSRNPGILLRPKV